MTATEIILQDRVETLAYVLAEICRRQRPDLTAGSDNWEDAEVIDSLLSTRSEEELIEEIVPTPFPPSPAPTPKVKAAKGYLHLVEGWVV